MEIMGGIFSNEILLRNSIMNENSMNNDVTMAGESERALLANRYRIIKQLGQGGMGSVWLAEDTQLDGKLFAIKMLPSILVANKRAFNQLKSEALVAMKLTHPNIVTLRAFEENNGNPFLVMDYIDGETLDDWLGDGEGERPRESQEVWPGRSPLREAKSLEACERPREPHQESGVIEADVVRLLKPIAEALDYAHAEGVVHRDIKPANVMIRKDGRPFIMDFGIAREIQETMTRVTGRMSSGTLMYMSPEQLHGLDPDKSQDIYSFAAMVYECLTGKPPFYRGQIEHQIDHDEPAPLSGDIAIASSVMAGLAKKPEDRPKSCVAVLEGNCEKREKELELGVSSQESGDREVWSGRSPLREAKSLETCERPREPRREFFVKFAAIGFLALGLIGSICALLGKKESKDSNDKFEVIEDSNDKFDVIEDGMVQLWEGGPYWAAKNIGADKPEDLGYCFWWGDTIGYKREGDKWVASDESDFNFSFNGDNTPIYGKSIPELESEGWIERKNGTYTLTSKYDAAQAHLGGAWRMPTYKELRHLLEKCEWTWTTINGKNGYVVRGRGSIYASKSIFLPCAGYGSGASLSYSGSDGYYWSSVPYSDSSNAYELCFSSGYHGMSHYSRGCGRSVRPVQGVTK